MFCINYTFSESELFDLITNDKTRELVRDRLDDHLLATHGSPDGATEGKHWYIFPLAEVSLLPDLSAFISVTNEDKVDWCKYIEECGKILAAL